MVAIDRDAGENGRVSYTILSGNLNDTFDINRSTGALFTTREVSERGQSVSPPVPSPPPDRQSGDRRDNHRCPEITHDQLTRDNQSQILLPEWSMRAGTVSRKSRHCFLVECQLLEIFSIV